MYNKIIKKMKLRLVLLKIISCALFVSAAIALIPFNFSVGPVSIRQNGISVWVFILFVIILIAAYIIAYAVIIMPSENALIVELDPQKCFELKKSLETSLTNPRDAYIIRMNSLYLMGDFKSAIFYADKLISIGENRFLVEALFTKARAQFFLNDITGMRETVIKFDGVVNNSKMSQKRRVMCENMRTFLNLMTAIAYNDKENVKFFSGKLKPWNNLEISSLQCNYLLGISADMLGDKKTAIYKLMLVKDRGCKTIFSRHSQYFLEKID